MRNITLANSEYYHIYNRGVDKREVFLDDEDFWKFFNCLRDFNNKTCYLDRMGALGISKNTMRRLHSEDFKRLGSFLKEQKRVIDIVSYNLIANHFHLIIKQLQDKGISNFMYKVGLTYTNYFNAKYKRSGSLFQGTYKAIHIDNEKYILRLIGYVNGNIEIHSQRQAEEYPWSSYRAIRNALSAFLQDEELLNLSGLSVLSGLNDVVLSQFNSVKQFDEFVKMAIEGSKENKKIKVEIGKYYFDTNV